MYWMKVYSPPSGIWDLTGHYGCNCPKDLKTHFLGNYVNDYRGWQLYDTEDCSRFFHALGIFSLAKAYEDAISWCQSQGVNYHSLEVTPSGSLSYYIDVALTDRYATNYVIECRHDPYSWGLCQASVSYWKSAGC